MRGKEAWQALRRLIDRHDRFLLTSHVFPEADAIGSEVAIALHLRSLGKEALILNDGPILERYRFLTRLFPVHSWKDPGSWPDPGWAEVAICLDVSSWDYLGPVGRWLRSIRPKVVSMDHHHIEEPFGDLDLNLEEASSTGEVLYRYFRAVGAPISTPMAEALYASILFDTWSFRLPNAANGSVKLAAELLHYGVDHREISRKLFETDTLTKLNLLRRALGTLHSECGGKLAWLTISDDLFRATGACFADADGVLDHLLPLSDVEVCVMFRQQGSRGVKVTFRSKGAHDVGRLAASFGGGGRTTAAGALIPESIHGAMELVLPRIYGILGRDAGDAETQEVVVSLGVSGIDG